MKKLIEQLKLKWNIQSNRDFVIIMIVFSLAGMFIGFERQPIFHFFGIDHMPLYLKILIYLPICFPLYQINLIFFGTVLGQFPFFWNKQKQLGRFFLRLLRLRT